MPNKAFFKLEPQRQQELLDRAMEVFASAPYESIKMQALIHAMDLPTGTFYGYFPDKDDLYLHICRVIDKKMYSAFEGGVLMFNIPVTAPVDLFSEMEKRFSKTQMELPEDLMRKYCFGPFAETAGPAFRNGLIKNMIDGTYRKDIDVELTTFMFISLCYNIAVYVKEHKITDPAAVKEISRKIIIEAMVKALEA